MKNSQRKASSEFVFWFASLVFVAIMSFYVWDLRLEDTGSSSVVSVSSPVSRSIRSKRLAVEVSDFDSSYNPSKNQANLQDASSNKLDVKEKELSNEKSQLDEDEIEELFVASLELIDNGDWPKGEKNLLRILKSDPKNVEALRELAMLNLLDKKDSLAATGYFERAFVEDPNDSGVMNELLQLYQEQGEINKGLKFLKAIPEEKKQGPAVDYGIATALSSNGKVEEAISFYQKAVDLMNEGDLTIKEDLADAYGQVGRSAEALDYYQSLLSEVNDPDRVKTLKVKIVATMIDNGDLEAAKEKAEELKKHTRPTIGFLLCLTVEV